MRARRSIRAWKEDLPLAAGATLIEMIDRAQAGIIKGLFVVGENPVGSLPPQTGVKEALGKLDLLVCQELFLTETAALAHVVLPAASAMEKAGTFTNTEGHVQAVRPAIDPVGDSRPDWEILSALSVFIGAPLEYGDAKEILKEIRAVIPGYGSLGPSPIPPAVDPTAVERYVNEGYRRDLATRYTLPARAVRQEGTVQLGLVQSLFHSGKLSTHSKGLLQIEPSGFLQMNPVDAARFGHRRRGIESVFRTAGANSRPRRRSSIVCPRAWHGFPIISRRTPCDSLTVSSIRTRKFHPVGRRLCR